ncbi:MAG: DNA polymerase ligase N-terminal domain-containing protein [Pirellulaceae bacterium]
MNSDSQAFVVLRHEFPHDTERTDHFDLMLQSGEALETWELSHWPPVGQQVVRRLPDHRLEYLEYQGPISGNRGRVTRVEQGLYATLVQESDRTEVILNGSGFTGAICIRRNESDQRWVLSVSPSESTGIKD